jgi:proteic killer suppression protein
MRNNLETVRDQTLDLAKAVATPTDNWPPPRPRSPACEMWNCSLLRRVWVAQVIESRAFPAELLRAARRKVLYLHDAAQLSDLRVPPANRLEALKGRWKGFYSIRINDQWRVVFRFESGNASDVRVVDYH